MDENQVVYKSTYSRAYGETVVLDIEAAETVDDFLPLKVQSTCLYNHFI